MKITGIKKAIGNFRKETPDGYRNVLMLDRSTGEVWVDFLPCSEERVYRNPAIVGMRGAMFNYYRGFDYDVNMKTVGEVARHLCDEWNKEVCNNG